MSEKALDAYTEDRDVFTNPVIYCIKKKCKHSDCVVTTFAIPSIQLNQYSNSLKRVNPKCNCTYVRIEVKRPLGGEWIHEFNPVISGAECLSFISGVIGFWYGFSVIKCKKFLNYFERNQTNYQPNYKVKSVSRRFKPMKNKINYLIYY